MCTAAGATLAASLQATEGTGASDEEEEDLQVVVEPSPTVVQDLVDEWRARNFEDGPVPTTSRRAEDRSYDSEEVTPWVRVTLPP